MTPITTDRIKKTSRDFLLQEPIPWVISKTLIHRLGHYMFRNNMLLKINRQILVMKLHQARMKKKQYSQFIMLCFIKLLSFFKNHIFKNLFASLFM